METTPPAQPKTLMEAVRYFSDAERTHDMAVRLRWPEGVSCPECGNVDVRYFVATTKSRSKKNPDAPPMERRLFECKDKACKRQFTAKTDTIFEDSALPLDKWFVAIWAIANCKNGISSYELSRATGITQKSAWHVLHRIRLAMTAGSFDKSGNVYEADESYVGGLAKNMHATKRKQRVVGRGAGAGDHKTAVMGILQRTNGEIPSRVMARVIRDANAKTLQRMVREHVEPGSQLMTDAHSGYLGLAADYIHQSVNHAEEYVRDNVHSNGIENFWSLMKRTIKGTYVSVDPLHLDQYVSEQAFRFNTRKDNDLGRFLTVLGSVAGRRLTWKELTSHEYSPVS